MLPRKMRYRPLPEAIEGLLGVAPTDVAEVTFEMSFMRLGAKFLVSLVTLEPVEQAAVVTRVSEATRETLKPMGAHAGVSLYGFGRGDEVVIAFVGPKLVVFGSPLAVKVGLENHAAKRVAQVRVLVEKALTETPAGSDIVFVFIPPERALREIAKEWARKARTDEKPILELETLLVSATAGDRIDLTARAGFKSNVAAAAAAAAGELREKILAEIVEDAPPEFRSFVEAVREIRFEGTGATLTASTSFKVDEPLARAVEEEWRNRSDPRIASNETVAIAALRSYLGAQNMFHRTDFYQRGFLSYANPKAGKGFPDLYEIRRPGSGGTAPKMVDLAFARATSPERPRAGYYFVDLVYEDYSIDCGLCAVPAKYGETGRRTFVIDVTGVVYESDNGGKAVTTFPDLERGWVPVGSRAAARRPRRPMVFKSQLKAKSAWNLKQFGYPCHLWSSDHNEDFPPSLDILFEKGYLLMDRTVLECPARPGETGYVYVRGLTSADPHWGVLAYEKDGCFSDGRNALFVGGNVQWMSEVEFQKALEKTREYLRSQGREAPGKKDDVF